MQRSSSCLIFCSVLRESFFISSFLAPNSKRPFFSSAAMLLLFCQLELGASARTIAQLKGLWTYQWERERERGREPLGFGKRFRRRRRCRSWRSSLECVGWPEECDLILCAAWHQIAVQKTTRKREWPEQGSDNIVIDNFLQISFDCAATCDGFAGDNQCKLCAWA